MILADTDILSAVAKVERLPLLFALLQTTEWHITPGVLAELQHSFDLGRAYAQAVFALLNDGQIQLAYLTPEEAAWCDTLPLTLGRGERETIAASKGRSGVVLSNESRVAHVCRENYIPCLRLPDILRALWVEGLATQAEVWQIVNDLQIEDRMQFKPTTLKAIFAAIDHTSG